MALATPARRVERPEDGTYILRHPFQQGHHWTQPARAYITNKAHVEISIRVRPGGLDKNAEHYVIGAWAARRDEALQADRADSGDVAEIGIAVTVPRRQCELCKVRGHDKQMEPPVLVGIGQADQFRQGVGFAPVESLIRLERLQPVDIGLPDVFEKVMPGEVLKPPNNGELDTPDFGFIGCAAEVANGQLPHQVIQGTPQVVDGIAQDEWPVVADLYHAVNAIDHGTLIWVVLPAHGDQIGIWSTGFPDLGPKQIDVTFRMI